MHDQLLDSKMQNHIANSPRLQKTTYRDENYLRHIITNIRRKKDSVIVLTNGEMGRLESIQAVRPKYRSPSIKVR